MNQESCGDVPICIKMCRFCDLKNTDFGLSYFDSIWKKHFCVKGIFIFQFRAYIYTCLYLFIILFCITVVPNHLKYYYLSF